MKYLFRLAHHTNHPCVSFKTFEAESPEEAETMLREHFGDRMNHIQITAIYEEKWHI
jgi:uncharacterized protein (UPF0212 family)